MVNRYQLQVRRRKIVGRKLLITAIAVGSISLGGFVGAQAVSQEEVSRQDDSVLAIRIAVSRTVSHVFRQGTGLDEKPTFQDTLPVLPSRIEYGTGRGYFDVVLLNVSGEPVAIPRFDASQVKLRVTESNGKEHLLSENPPYAGGMGRNVDANVLLPGGCLVHRVYIDWYGFPKSLSGQKVMVQVIYRAPEVLRDIKISIPWDQTVERRTLALTKELNLWNGEVRSSGHEVRIH